MTTKDQAEAFFRSLPPVPDDKTWGQHLIDSIKSAPDCRTCSHLYPDLDAIKRCGTACFKGDKYRPAPAVVLWRTE